MAEKIGELRFGLELECQEVFGESKESLGEDYDPEIDESATDGAIADYRYQLNGERLSGIYGTSEFNKHLLRLTKEHGQKFVDWYKDNERFSYDDFVDEFGSDDIIDDYLSEIATENTETIYYDREKPDYIDWVVGELSTKIKQDWSVVSDASISGCEFVLDGSGVDYDETISAIDVLVDGLDDLVVDGNCSFHVHVSEANRKHRYGPKFQYLLCKYIADNIKSCPTPLLYRWADSWRNRYFAFQKSDKRMTFVSYRSEHDTWEFRCFGGVDTAEDMKFCVDMTRDAYTYARKKMMSNFIGYNDNDWPVLIANFEARLCAELRKRTQVKKVA
jgi:hypothetical protein